MSNDKIGRGSILVAAIAGVVVASMFGQVNAAGDGAAASQPASQPSETRADVVFSGGYETYGPDGGRPVVLIAAALKVPAEVFRATFKNVRPAGPGQEPQEAQVRQNKAVLMRGLSPYGVTDDRLNEVSNYYRYAGFKGEMWRNTPATAYARVKDGVVTGFVITNAGSGYSSVPTVAVKGMPGVKATVTLMYGTDFAKNGAIKEIVVMPAKK